tara:strand:- start:1368 stop:1823 length:456 start_codon:yes stop_codon:yes gene_type:complete
MRTNEFVIRGQTASGETEKLSFSGFKPGYAYKLIEFVIYPSTDIGGVAGSYELVAALTAAKTAEDPANPNFNNDGLIGTAKISEQNTGHYIGGIISVVNDTFLITQDLLLTVEDTQANNHPVNWQCKFMPVKISAAEEAVANYKQFTISDG